MAEDLGEVRVQIEQDGAQEAADTIGDAVGEGSADGGGGGAGGGIAGALGGISTKLAGILGFVAFLATLKPIQELLSGLQRLFSVAILPLVALLTTFLRPLLQDLLRIIGGLDFNNLLQDISQRIVQGIRDLSQDIIAGLQSAIFDTGGGTTAQERTAGAFIGGFTPPGFQNIGRQVGAEVTSNDDLQSALASFARLNADLATGNIQGAATEFNELSSTTLDQNSTDTMSKETLRRSLGVNQ